MDTGACCVAPSAPQRSDDQIVPAHPGDCWNTHQTNHQQPFLDAWLQMQVLKLTWRMWCFFLSYSSWNLLKNLLLPTIIFRRDSLHVLLYMLPASSESAIRLLVNSSLIADPEEAGSMYSKTLSETTTTRRNPKEDSTTSDTGRESIRIFKMFSYIVVHILELFFET